MSASQGRAAERQPDIGQAPGDLGKLQAFVNTLDVEAGTDELATPAALDSWLRQAGLVTGSGGRAGPVDLARAVELREALRALLRSHVTHAMRGERPAEDRPAARGPAARGPAALSPAARITEIAAPLRTAIRADADGGICLVAADSGTEGGLTRLLLIGAAADTLGTWARLKVCSADDCQWAFYDRSPTRSGCWCSMQICGSRAKSRAYRTRAARTG
jgi:predicted RNA-binding Zn ribbon-like protein